MLSALFLAAIPMPVQGDGVPVYPPYGSSSVDYLIIDVGETVPTASLPAFEAGLAETLTFVSRGHLTPNVDSVQVTFPQPTGEMKLIKTRREAFALARAQMVEPGDYNRVAIMAPRDYFNQDGYSVCIGTVDNHVVFCNNWEDGPTWPSGNPSQALLIHELGHSYGFRHSNLWIPDSSTDPVANGSEHSRGDPFDPMGGYWKPYWTHGALHYFNPWYMHRLGWIEPQEIRDIDENTVPAGMTVLLRPLQSPVYTGPGDAQPLAIRVRRGGETSYPGCSPPGCQQDDDYMTDYWIFWREYEGILNPEIPGAMAAGEGPVLHMGYRTNIGRSILVDLDPTPVVELAPFRDSAFQMGQTFTDPGSGLAFTFDEITTEGLAKVTVALPTGYEAAPLPPRVKFDASSFPPRGASVVGETSWTFGVDATDPEGVGIDSVEFWLFPNTDEFLGYVAKGNPIYTETFPRVHEQMPVQANGLWADNGPGQHVSGSYYEWQADLAPGGNPLPSGIYFVVVRAVTTDADPRANIVWRPFVIDRDEPQQP